ncbi:MAG: DUF2490 domain-containing protein [Saprospiraceae bacterium]|nr:DUF2490 domain-containing protein [Saprospiraceae bacterium]
MPVRTQTMRGVLSPVVMIALVILCFSPILKSQTLVGGSIFSAASDERQGSNQLWFQYQNSFKFKDRMYIDSDFGHIFNTNASDKRLNARSVFKYEITENLKIGTGMGFFWNYDRPNLMQELRFVQEINYYKDFGSSIMFHDLRIEEQIQQSSKNADDYDTRLRYRIGLSFPTETPMYFGVYDEVFKTLSHNEGEPFFSINRAGAFLGYRTYRYLSFEAHLMLEDRYSKEPGATSRSLILQIVAKHII